MHISGGRKTAYEQARLTIFMAHEGRTTNEKTLSRYRGAVHSVDEWSDFYAPHLDILDPLLWENYCAARAPKARSIAWYRAALRSELVAVGMNYLHRIDEHGLTEDLEGEVCDIADKLRRRKKATVKSIQDAWIEREIVHPSDLVEDDSAKYNLPQLRATRPEWKREVLALAEGPWRNIMLVLAVTGARPAEIAKGVSIARMEEQREARLKIEIKGAKIKEKNGVRVSGQQWRVLTFDPEKCPYIAELFGAAPVLEGHRLEVAMPRNRKTGKPLIADNITKHIRVLAKRALGNEHGELVSAYCFRHDLVDELAGEGGSAEDRLRIAEALGHMSVHTQRHYGFKRKRGGGGHALVRVDVESPVREPGSAEAKAVKRMMQQENELTDAELYEIFKNILNYDDEPDKGPRPR